MAKPTFSAAQTVYDTDGRKLYFRRDLGDGTAIVSRWLATEGWDGETEEYVSDEPIIKAIDKLFSSAPTEVLAAEVADLRATIESARSDLSFVKHQVREAETERARCLAALTSIEPLKNIERFIAGEITHFVMVDVSYSGELYGDVSVTTFGRALTYMNDRGRADGMKLLALYGDSNRNLTWRINHYSDGSGSNKTVIPCLSEDEARQRAAEFLDTIWAMPRRPGFDHRIAAAIKAADTLGFPVPEEARAAHDAVLISGCEKRVADAEQALATAQEALAKARGEA